MLGGTTQNFSISISGLTLHVNYTIRVEALFAYSTQTFSASTYHILELPTEETNPTKKTTTTTITTSTTIESNAYLNIQPESFVLIGVITVLLILIIIILISCSTSICYLKRVHNKHGSLRQERNTSRFLQADMDNPAYLMSHGSEDFKGMAVPKLPDRNIQIPITNPLYMNN